MTIRPIIFSGPMVRALLEGRKTQTRRVIKSVRVFATPETRAFSLKGDELKRAMQNASRFRLLEGDGWFWEADAFEWQHPAERTGWMAHIGYAFGDLLYVRENWGINYYRYIRPSPIPKDRPADMESDAVIYFATENDAEICNEMPQCPSIHMPRSLSRLTLEVTDVRVERVQEISEDDAAAEGVELGPSDRPDWGWRGVPGLPDRFHASEAFRDLWGSINEKRGFGWDENPWVVAVTFDVHLKNVDALVAERKGASND